MTSDPFRLVHRLASPVIWDLARRIHAITRPAAAGIWIGRGWSPDSTEHATGRALDVIVSAQVGRRPTPDRKAAGNDLADWLVAHARTIGIRHIIWDRRIYRTRYAQWGPLPGRNSKSNISAWHEDHIHVWLEHDNGAVPNAPLITLDTIKKEIADMDPNELAAAILSHPVTANGKTAAIVDHMAELFVLNKAQSSAVGTEVARDNKQHDAVMRKLNTIDKKLTKNAQVD